MKTPAKAVAGEQKRHPEQAAPRQVLRPQRGEGVLGIRRWGEPSAGTCLGVVDFSAFTVSPYPGEWEGRSEAMDVQICE